MPTNIGSISNYFPYAFENSVPMTLTSTILAGATTVAVTGMTNYTNGQIVTFTVDPTTPSLKQVFTGTVNTGAGTVTNVIWTEMPTGGVNVAHSAGATIIDYVSATHWDMAMTGIGKSLNPNGSLITSAVTSALNITGGAAGGWTPTGFTPSAVAYNGNRSYTLTFSANDLTPTLSNGMRLQMTRTVAAPTQCTSLNGTTQYYSKTSPAGMTFTNNFVVSAHIKLSSYNGAQQTIASRYNGTSGWGFYIDSVGRVNLIGLNAGSSNWKNLTSYQSIPINKWVHVVAQLDMSASTNSPTVNYILIDGVDVPATQAQSGTNPTALIQAGNLEVGSWNGGLLPFNGKLAQVAVYSAKVTEANILASISQGLAGTETSLISAYSFNNSINDLNANANNLTANGSALATNADSPFGGQGDGTISSTLDYCRIISNSFSTNTTITVFVASGNTIPTTGGVSAVSYSTQATPYQCPPELNKYRYHIPLMANSATSSTSAVVVNGLTTPITIPNGIASVDITAFSEQASCSSLQSMFIYSGATSGALTTQLAASQQNSITAPGFCRHTYTPASGSIYYSVAFSTSNGANAANLTATTTAPTFLLVECSL